MLRTPHFARWLLAALALFSAPALAHDFMAGQIGIDRPWARPLPPVTPNGAVYLSMYNMNSASDALVGVSTPMAERVELHRVVQEDGLMKMQPQSHIDLPAGQGVTLEPGGLHLMLMGLTAPLVEGEQFPLTLTFRSGATTEIVVNVMQPENDSNGAMDHSSHGESGHDSHGTD